MKKEKKMNNKIAIILVLIISIPVLLYLNNERIKMKYPGIVRDELFYKYFTKVREYTVGSPVGPNRSEEYIFNVKALYDDLGYTQKINELNEKYKARGINLVIPENDHINSIDENNDGYGLPLFAKEYLYGEIFSGTYLFDEQIINPDELMSLNSLRNSSIKSVMPGVGASDSSSYNFEERLQKNSKNGQKIKTVDDIINNIDYKKTINESAIGFAYYVSTKKTERDIIIDSSNKDLDSDSYKNNPEYVKTQEAIQKELNEKYGSITSRRRAVFYSPKSETPSKTYDYSDPNYEGI